MIIDVNPEFGYEVAISIPYAYWLHKNDQLDGVVTCKGMKPFYYFCEDVREEFDIRTIDNAAAGLNSLPNQWTHHNALAVTGKDYSELNEEEQANINGVLDYSKWICPPYAKYYKNTEFIFDKEIVFITNKFNIEHGHKPYGYFNIECLYEMFNYLTSKNYTVIYKRVTNQEPEFAIDQNEINSLHQGYHNIKANVEGVGEITDRELVSYYEDVYLLDDIVENSKYSYNETQLKLMANCSKFISVCGGNAILSSMFGGTVITYVHTGKELRPNYFSKNGYFKKLTNANFIPVFDVIGEINQKTYNHKVNNTGKNDYKELLETIKRKF